MHAGSTDGQGLSIGIIVAQFNSFITERLLEGALRTLRGSGVSDDAVTVAYVPGAFELPLAAKKMAASGRFHAVVCLGCVIRGETPHFEYVSQSAAHGILQAGLDTSVPVIFGVLTTNTVEQARARAGAQFGNSGASSAQAAIHMANLFRQMQLE